MKNHIHLHVIAFGLAFGITWGVACLLTGLLSMWTGWAHGFVEAMSSIYIGYGATWFGSILGGIWGFADGFIGGAILALLYNYFCKSFPRA